MQWTEWIGQTVFIRTKHNKVYTGKVVLVDNESHITFLKINDKFGQPVMFATQEIVEIKREVPA